MTPNRIEVTNYRSFVDRTVLELRPLTLLFGPNNCGKSSLLRLLPLLADSLKPEAQGPIDLASPALRGASFLEILTRPPLSRGNKELQIALEWGSRPGALRWQWTIRGIEDYDRRLEIVSECRVLKHGREWISFEWAAPSGEAILGTTFNIQLPGVAEPKHTVEFQGLMPRIKEVSSKALSDASSKLSSLATTVQWLGSVRDLPPRTIDTRLRRPSMDSKGRGATELLVNDYHGSKEIFPGVSAWFESALQLGLDIEPRADSFAVVLFPLAEPLLRVNLVDTGEGIAQVLPVLIALERALKSRLDVPRILAFEQPELHLHPAAQTILADYFCTVAADEKAPISVIETHSENFLLSLQLAVLENRLSTERVAAYWVQRLPDGRSRLNRLQFNPDGHPEGWPPGIFTERTMQSRRIVSARQRRDLAK